MNKPIAISLRSGYVIHFVSGFVRVLWYGPTDTRLAVQLQFNMNDSNIKITFPFNIPNSLNYSSRNAHGLCHVVIMFATEAGRGRYIFKRDEYP